MTDTPKHDHQMESSAPEVIVAQRTPGPWRACTDKNDMPQLLYSGLIASLHHSPDPDGYVAVVSDEREIGDANPESDRALLVECQANAFLIASAPALLAALRLHVGKNGHTAGCMKVKLPSWGCSDRCIETREAIAKATGDLT